MAGTYLGNCPAEVADAITSILRESILLIRMAGNGDDADYCAVEANHIHNLPSLLRSYNRSRLERYLTWAQTAYASGFQKRFDRPPTMFMSEWERLENYLRSTKIEAPEDGVAVSMNGAALRENVSRAV